MYDDRDAPIKAQKEARAQIIVEALNSYTPPDPNPPRCICSGQGGDIWSAECPVHDPH